MSSIEVPFTIHVPDDKLDALKHRLEQTTFPDELDDAGWEYGPPLAEMRRLVSYWKDGYDWRNHEARLNELPHFTRDIDVDGHGTLNIHYIHQKSSVPDAIPLLFLHGWPGNFLEVTKILPLLVDGTSAGAPSFHVVAMSLPGYGFSEASKKKRFATAQHAEVANKLMISLGYNEYVTQGGDWGRHITYAIAHKYGHKHSKAWHTNFPVGSLPTFTQNPLNYLKHLITPYSGAEKRGLKLSQDFEDVGSAYSWVHITQTQTIGYALADSPAAMLAWIYHKLVVWSDKYPWTDDEILTWMSIYWFSRAGPAAAVRIYHEHVETGECFGYQPRSTIPLGVSYFPVELTSHPVSWLNEIGNVVFTARHDSGGHYAAYERPDVLVDDVRKMFGKGGPAFGVVPGKTGYA